jgi:anti-sigma B factor antagonist
MKISTRQVDGITVIDAKGRITLGDGDVLLRDTIAELLATGHRKLLLNLAEVSYIDSSGLGILVGAYTTVRNQGGELQLLKLTKRVRDLLQITKLYTVFTVREDEITAIQSLNTVATA